MPAFASYPDRARVVARRLSDAGRLIVLIAAVSGVRAATTEPIAEPLAPRSGPRGGTMFASLPPEQTGVVVANNYADPKMWWERREEFKFGAVGTGVAVGDYDNDGRPDLFVVSKTETSKLFRNLGGWKFEDVTERAGLLPPKSVLAEGVAWLKRSVGQGDAPPDEAWKQGATWADVNNDGWLDLYVCRFNAPNLLYVNQRDGTFKEEAAARGLAIVDASGMAAFCDYDRDGWLDVYVYTNILDGQTKPSGQRDYLFHNAGDGKFVDVTERAGIIGENQAHSATWWDYDQDGWPDLYVANDFAVPDSLYHNNRDGTFTNRLDAVVPHTPHSSMGSDLGDVNNDGRLDLFVADMATTSHAADMRGMAKIRSLLTGMDESAAGAPQTMRNVLYVNTGTGRMLEAAHLAGLEATDWTWSPRFEDLDNDGRLDLYVTNGMVRELHNVDLNQRMSASESLAEGARVMKASPVLVETNLAFRNLGDLQFVPVGPEWGLDRKGVSFGSVLADFDGDGDLDLVYGNYLEGPSVLRNDSADGHRLIVALRGTRSNRFGVGAVVQIETAAGRQVRQLVLARGYNSSSEPILHFGLGDDAIVQRLTVNWPSGAVQRFERVKADQRLTITEPADVVAGVADIGPDSTSQAKTDKTFADVSAEIGFALEAREETIPVTSEQPFLPLRLNRRGPSLAVADLTGDGRDDVVLGGTTRDAARLLVGGADGKFVEAKTANIAAPPPLVDGPVLAIDVNGDGANDLLLTRSGTTRPAGAADYQPRLLLNNGQGVFLAADATALPVLPINAGAAVAADFDRDGQLDVFLGARSIPGQYPLTPQSALLRNRGSVGGGWQGFADVTDAWAPGLKEIGMVTSALATDVDDDGWIDLLVALDWGPVKCFRNDAGRRFDDGSERLGFAAAGAGWWTSLTAADFNGDGRLDYVVGNVGLNTPYRATAEAPARLFYGAFAESGPPLLLEGYYEEGRLYPRRSRNEFATRIPSIMRRFPRNDVYARATLGEIFGEERLQAARSFAATELRSGVFLSQPDGRFRFAPLPRLAQIAPLQGMVAGDFDGDGHADIYAVQNSYAPVPLVGRFDGGLSQLLRGDGRGGFVTVSQAESGLIVPGDAKALALIGLRGGGRPDFLITRNNTATLAFRNSSVGGRHAIAVRLRGPVGNPAAIGARVTAELAKGARQIAEVHAGEGWLSQSTATLFLASPDDQPLRRVQVRWPSGASSTHEVEPGATTLTISAP
ncbi:FG-GAP-like repeat-containing protein [Opitutus terrae]|uniref:ASPIC/UnbV domain protein n=1 Tax=Opitutus terrae (strain DSM 11246 / JCM 15787 / PB90-1) TaxID=452637 RepID=B1ZRT8_OPITP|nr:FG-GAP-like repeat-containing protein [Opitutus terrae]ACB73781.1 ASPIC/UnbV domain protein [Opitutus terrae PB90-1]